MPLSSKTTQTNVQNHLWPGRQADRRINRRTLLKGVGGLAAASLVGGGAVVALTARAGGPRRPAEEFSGRHCQKCGRRLMSWKANWVLA